jgi:hypothetical protein
MLHDSRGRRSAFLPTPWTTTTRGFMKRLLLGICFLGAAFATGAVPATATVTDQRPITIVETTGPDVISDLPCLEGEEFLATGEVTARIRFVEDEKGTHFVFWARNEGTLVPVDGTGPTYVESGNVDRRVQNINLINGVFVASFTNNDSFVAHQDGKVDASSTIRIHEQEQFVGFDTDGDGVPDVVRVEFQKARFSCP